MSPATRRLAFAAFSVFCVLAALTSIALTNRTATPRAPYQVTGANGVISVPSTMHIEAFDPATNSNIDDINVWAAVGRGSQPPACQLDDGDTISVDNTQDGADGLWVHITAGRCSGWVLSEFVTR